MRRISLFTYHVAVLLSAVCADLSRSHDLAVQPSPPHSFQSHSASGNPARDAPMILVPTGEFAMGDDLRTG